MLHFGQTVTRTLARAINPDRPVFKELGPPVPQFCERKRRRVKQVPLARGTKAVLRSKPEETTYGEDYEMQLHRAGL